MWMPIRLDLEGEHTGSVSPLCMECPHGITGCCASPPGFDWSDIGRVLTLGGREWLKGELEAGNITTLQHKHGNPCRGLQLKRIANDALNSATWPTKCGYHGDRGCTIGRDRRPATCNYYLCDDAYARAGEAGEPAREAQAILQALYGRWRWRSRRRFPPGGRTAFRGRKIWTPCSIWWQRCTPAYSGGTAAT